MVNDKTWHEDDAFWKIFALSMFSEQRWEDAPKEAEDIISLIGINQGARVLDLCCGVGRHSLALARSGYSVTGVDRTKEYLDVAKKKAKNEELDVEFLEGDMRTFSRPETFDAVVNLFTAFGYFEDPNEDKQVVKNVYESLKPGGVFLVDVMGKETIARIYQARDWHEDDDGTIYLQDRKVTKDWSWLYNRWIRITKDGLRQEFDVSQTIYSARELKELLEDCGFKNTKAYGNFKGVPYDQTSKRLVVVGNK